MVRELILCDLLSLVSMDTKAPNLIYRMQIGESLMVRLYLFGFRTLERVFTNTPVLFPET